MKYPNNILFSKYFISVFFISFSMLYSCGPQELSVDDFSFEGPLGSEGAQIEKLGKNYFKITLGHAPGHPDWPNKLNFLIRDNAKGNSLRLVVEGPPEYAFNEYFQSWSYDGDNWQPLYWENSDSVSPQIDTLIFPTFTQDVVYCGTQVPLSFKRMEEMIQEWKSSPYVKVHVIGKSTNGNKLYRVEISDKESPHPPDQRWVHYIANQHPGEFNSHWRMAGMINWLLSDSAADFRKRSISHFIPFMSPDGPSRGWYRVNAEGVDMNRSYRPEGADSSEQTHEPYLFQNDLEELMKSKAPVTSLWSMHTWSGPVEPIMKSGPEIGRDLSEWTEFRDIIRKLDQDNLIEDLKLREGKAGYGYISWSEGPHHQFGITTILCEGAGNIYTKDENVKSGETLMQSIAKYYSGVKPKD